MAVLADCGITAIMYAACVFGGSLTLLAETIRGTLTLTIEAYALYVMRRIHRGRFGEFEFGVGKLEQMCNIAIAVGMIATAVWIALGAVRLAIDGHGAEVPSLGLAVAAAINAVNTGINGYAWLGMRRAARTGRSVILEGQRTARFAKFVSSTFLQCTMTVAAITSVPTVAAVAYATGAAFVSMFLCWTGFKMLRAGLPDMLDRSIDEAGQLAVLRALARHYDAFGSLGRVRSRRSGEQIFIEITLGFAPDLTIAEIHGRIAGIREAIAEEVEGADISILAAPESAI